MLNFPFVAVSLVSFTDTFISLKKHHQGVVFKKLSPGCEAVSQKAKLGNLHAEFYTACFQYTCCSVWPQDLSPESKNESKFCHINSLREVAVFSY